MPRLDQRQEGPFAIINLRRRRVEAASASEEPTRHHKRHAAVYPRYYPRAKSTSELNTKREGTEKRGRRNHRLKIRVADGDAPPGEEHEEGSESSSDSDSSESESEPEGHEEPKSPTAPNTPPGTAIDDVAAAPRVSGVPLPLSNNRQGPASTRPPVITSTSLASATALPATGGQIQPVSRHVHGLPPAALACIIVFSILGFIGLVALALWFLRRRRRSRGEYDEKQGFQEYPSYTTTGEDATHLELPPPSLTRDTVTTTSTALFASDPHHRPHTLSTDRSRSVRPLHSQLQLQPQPPPTANPFADPPLNKAYNMLNGRPASTTLTHKNEWTSNPFEDPRDERFDPFGTLMARARAEQLKFALGQQTDAKRGTRGQ